MYSYLTLCITMKMENNDENEDCGGLVHHKKSLGSSQTWVVEIYEVLILP